MKPARKWTKEGQVEGRCCQSLPPVTGFGHAHLVRMLVGTRLATLEPLAAGPAATRARLRGRRPAAGEKGGSGTREEGECGRMEVNSQGKLARVGHGEQVMHSEGNEELFTRG